MKIFKDCFTGKDNKTYDIGRIIACVSVALYWYIAIKTHATSLMDIGGGFAATIGGCFGGLFLKSGTEPENEQLIKFPKKKSKK